MFQLSTSLYDVLFLHFSVLTFIPSFFMEIFIFHIEILKFFYDFFHSMLFSFPGSVSINCTQNSLSYVFNTGNVNPGHLVEMIVSDSKKNAAKFSKHFSIVDPLIGPLSTKCSSMVGTALPATFTVEMAISNVRYVVWYCYVP